jgi:hypothetical protein
MESACLTVLYRARETERPDALFKDPFARRLAGERGEEIARTLPFGDRHIWSFTARTVLFDHFVTEQIRQGGAGFRERSASRWLMAVVIRSVSEFRGASWRRTCDHLFRFLLRL